MFGEGRVRTNMSSQSPLRGIDSDHGVMQSWLKRRPVGNY